MKKYFILSCIILMVFVSACTPGPVTQTVIETIESHASSMPIEMPFIVLPTSTPTIFPTTVEPNSAGSQELVEECLQVNHQIPDDLGLSGVLVVNPGAPKLNNLDDHMFYGVPLEGGGSLSTDRGDLAISPSGQHMAYIDSYLGGKPTRTEKRVLRVIRSSGHSLDMSYWPEEWQWIIGWVDDQNLALYTSNKEIVILNPLEGTWRIFEQPDWLIDSDNHYYSYRYFPGYSPNLEWVIDRTDNEGVALKNVRTGQTFWQKNGDYWTDWVWSLDSVTSAISSEQMIFVVRNGDEKAVFNLDKFEYSGIYNLSLSFDGQKLAFSTSSKEDYDPKLVIWDMEQNKVFKLCDNEYSVWWRTTTWSLDGRFVTQKAYNSEYGYFDVLIDTQTSQAFFFESDYLKGQIAWLAKP